MAERESKQEAQGASNHGMAHVAPAWLLIGTFVALLSLTGATVAVTNFDLGRYNLYLAMGIATAKAMLVALFFMHLAFDKPVNALYLLTALVFVALFVSLSLMDSVHYQPDVKSFVQGAP